MTTSSVDERRQRLQSGLVLLTGDTPIERVSTRSGRLDLLVTAAHFEMIEGTLDAGERMTLVPPERKGQRVDEAYLLLEGILELVGEVRLRLVPGDRLIVEALTAPAIFVAVTPVRFLVVTDQPFFHEISGVMEDLRRMAREVEVQDGYTAEHCLRLQRLSFATGEELSLSPQQLHWLDYGAYLHDLGKIKVPVSILQKPGKLDEGEWAVIKRHPTFGREILETTALRAAGDIVEQHHERLDGSGYPYGLSGEEVLVESQIVAVADTYDAMTTDRPYRKALAPDVAFAELERYAGAHHRREVYRAFMAAVKRVERVE